MCFQLCITITFSVYNITQRQDSHDQVLKTFANLQEVRDSQMILLALPCGSVQSGACVHHVG